MLVAIALAMADSEDDTVLLPSFLVEAPEEHLLAYQEAFSEDDIETLSVRGSVEKMELFVASRNCPALTTAYNKWTEEIREEKGILEKRLNELMKGLGPEALEAAKKIGKSLTNEDASTGHSVFEIRRCVALAERRHQEARPQLEQFLADVKSLGNEASKRFMRQVPLD